MSRQVARTCSETLLGDPNGSLETLRSFADATFGLWRSLCEIEKDFKKIGIFRKFDSLPMGQKVCYLLQNWARNLFPRLEKCSKQPQSVPEVFLVAD